MVALMNTHLLFKLTEGRFDPGRRVSPFVRENCNVLEFIRSFVAGQFTLICLLQLVLTVSIISIISPGRWNPKSTNDSAPLGMQEILLTVTGSSHDNH